MIKTLPSAVLVAALLCSVSANAASYYVNQATGSDNYAGTQSAPWATVAHAASVSLSPGDTVNVAPGTYYGGFTVASNGTSTAYIHFLSTTKYGAKIVPPSGSTDDVGFWARGDFVKVDGFEVDGSNYAGGTYWTIGIEGDGNSDIITHNLVHNIHNINNYACNGTGAAGIDFYGFYYGKTGGWANDNIVHDVTWNGTCGFDQGIYANSAGILISNNIVYNITAATAIENWHAATNNTIVNNTVYNNYVGIYIGHDTSLGGVNDYTTVANNIIMDTTYGIDESEVGTHNKYTNNLLYQTTNDYYDMQNPHSGPPDADPLFVNAGTDFHIQSGSPAIGAGSATWALTYDFDGVMRPNPPSIGAYEYVKH